MTSLLSDGSSHRRLLALLSIVIGVGIAGCTGGAPVTGTTGDTPTESTPTTTRVTPSDDASITESTAADSGDARSAMSSRLYELVTADDPAAFADERGMAYRNGSTKVEVTLRSGAAFPDGFAAEVVSRHDRTAVAWVPVDRLRALATHEDVTFVREPPTVRTADLDA